MAEEYADPNKGKARELVSAAFSGPAVYANQFAVTIGPGGVRISAVEQENPGAPLHFRTAVVTSFPDAVALRKLLGKMLEGFEAKFEAGEKEPPPKEKTSETTEDG